MFKICIYKCSIHYSPKSEEKRLKSLADYKSLLGLFTKDRSIKKHWRFADKLVPRNEKAGMLVMIGISVSDFFSYINQNHTGNEIIIWVAIEMLFRESSRSLFDGIAFLIY